jgi:hypothetical protein
MEKIQRNSLKKNYIFDTKSLNFLIKYSRFTTLNRRLLKKVLFIHQNAYKSK